MIIGIAGCQRTGKTHAAKVIAEQLGLKYVPTNVSAITAKYPKAKSNFKERMRCQNEILEHFEKLLDDDGIVLDRTPVDLLVYTLDAFHWGNVNEKNNKAVEEYLRKALTLLARFDIMILTERLDEVVADTSKAPTDSMYMMKIDHMMASFGNYHYILRGGTYEERNRSISETIEQIRTQAMGGPDPQ